MTCTAIFSPVAERDGGHVMEAETQDAVSDISEDCATCTTA